MEEEVLLIERAIAGDAGAFGQLYDNYHPKLYRFIYLKTGTRQDAEDLAHQVFLHAWLHIKGYVDKGYPFSSWLFRIARNAIIDHYRTRKDPLRMEELDPETIGGPVNLEREAEQGLEMEELKIAILNLPEKYQDVIIFRFVEELSLKETAEAMSKSEGAIKLLQHRAVKTLQKELKKSHGPVSQFETTS